MWHGQLKKIAFEKCLGFLDKWRRMACETAVAKAYCRRLKNLRTPVTSPTDYLCPSILLAMESISHVHAVQDKQMMLLRDK